jgi:hypothetical protein
LTLLLVGAIDFCRALYAYNTINHCARNAAIWASDPYANTDKNNMWGGQTPPTSISPYASVTAAAKADASNLSSNASDWTVSLSYGTDNVKVGGNTKETPTTVTVAVTYNFHLLTNFIFNTTTIPMTRSVTMRASPPTPN